MWVDALRDILTPQEVHLQESQEPEQLQVEQELQILVRWDAFNHGRAEVLRGQLTRETFWMLG